MKFKVMFNGLSLYDLDHFKQAADNLIETKRAFCMLGAAIPTTPVHMQLERFCARVTSIELVDKDFFVDVEFLNTPMGNIAQQLHKEGVSMEIRPIGVGTVTNNVVQKDYELWGFYFEQEILR